MKNTDISLYAYPILSELVNYDRYTDFMLFLEDLTLSTDMTIVSLNRNYDILAKANVKPSDYKSLYNFFKTHTQIISITLAYNFSFSALQHLYSLFYAKLGIVVFKITIDESLVGGFELYYKGSFINKSLKEFLASFYK